MANRIGARPYGDYLAHELSAAGDGYEPHVDGGGAARRGRVPRVDLARAADALADSASAAPDLITA